MCTVSRLLSDQTIAAIEALFPRYPTRQAVVLPALHIINEQLGYVPQRAVEELAALLGLAPAQIQDTLSFYGFFKQDKPQGKVRIWFCHSISCAARGAEELLEHLCQTLGVRPGQTTPDGMFTLEAAECLGLCDGSPAMLANERVYTDLSREKLDQIIKSLRTAS